tara:strand:+ start:916 stop:2778 length:1863 start_codon:yes stop_codon:yes gene_type:complete
MSRFLAFFFSVMITWQTPSHASLTNTDIINPAWATSPTWLALLSYQQGLINRNYTSQADSTDFFLASNGKRDPYAELIATFDGLFLPNNLGDAHPRCRFPARYHWLIEKLPVVTSIPAAPKCTAFDKFKEILNARGATMVFPAAYLNSPSSMFGHTLLRIDQHGQNDSNRILAYTASYAAKNDPSDNQLSFVLKGLMGGYPGEMSILPYYMKLKEYRDIESRDIWEYPLNLTQEETEQMVRHLWEVSGETFDYFFFTENCSYRLLGVLDSIRSETPMLNDFRFHAIPVDTVRAAWQHDYIVDAVYRPSIVNQFQYQLSLLNSEQQDLVFALVNHPSPDYASLEQYPLEQRAAVLDVAFLYSRLANSRPQQEAAKRSLRLLRNRNKLTINTALPKVPTPILRDDQGHLSGRLQISNGKFRKQSYIGLDWRPAYHDLSDPGLGYPLGSELKFLDMSFRYYQDDGVKMEDLSLIGIKSITARNRFFRPLSWSFDIGGGRIEEHNKRSWAPHIEGLAGPAWEFKGGLLYVLAGGKGQISNKLQDGFDVRAKTSVAYLRKTPSQQLLLSTNFEQSTKNHSKPQLNLLARHDLQIGNQWNIFWELQRMKFSETYQTEFEVGVKIFY